MQHRIFLVDEINIFCSDCAATCGSKRVEEMSQDAFKCCTQTCLKCHKTLILNKTGAFNCFNGERSRQEAERLIQQIQEHESMHEFFQQYWKQPRSLENRHTPDGESLFQRLVNIMTTDGSGKTHISLECAKQEGLPVFHIAADVDPTPGHNED